MFGLSPSAISRTLRTDRNPALRRKRIIVALSALGLLANAGGAANYLVNMITEQKKVCLYCVAGAAINFATLAVAWPNLRDGVRRIF